MDRKTYKLRHFQQSVSALRRRVPALMEKYELSDHGSRLMLHGPGEDSVTIPLPHGGSKSVNKRQYKIRE